MASQQIFSGKHSLKMHDTTEKRKDEVSDKTEDYISELVDEG
jgi:hypothetical protein